MSKWIKVEHAMPQKQQNVIIFAGNRIFHGFWDFRTTKTPNWYDSQNCWPIDDDVTHWMELPKHPKD